MTTSKFMYIYTGQKFDYDGTTWKKVSTTKAMCVKDSDLYNAGELMPMKPKTVVNFDKNQIT